jgi:hypothetical protein
MAKCDPHRHSCSDHACYWPGAARNSERTASRALAMPDSVASSELDSLRQSLRLAEPHFMAAVALHQAKQAEPLR